MPGNPKARDRPILPPSPDVRKLRFGQTQALNGVSFDVPIPDRLVMFRRRAGRTRARVREEVLHTLDLGITPRRLTGGRSLETQFLEVTGGLSVTDDKYLLPLPFCAPRQ